MSKSHESIDDETARWLAKQNMFFVATAPLAGDGHINCSPKGADSFRVLDPKVVGYLDLTGSGIETVAHVRENGRVVLMFCAFEGPPKIVRIHGHGTVLTASDAEWSDLAPRFPVIPGTRAIVRVDVERVATSCGYGVPRYAYLEPRDTLERWAKEKGEAGVKQYQERNNRRSLDGLVGLDPS